MTFTSSPHRPSARFHAPFLRAVVQLVSRVGAVVSLKCTGLRGTLLLLLLLLLLNMLLLLLAPLQAHSETQLASLSWRNRVTKLLHSLQRHVHDDLDAAERLHASHVAALALAGKLRVAELGALAEQPGHEPLVERAGERAKCPNVQLLPLPPPPPRRLELLLARRMRRPRTLS